MQIELTPEQAMLQEAAARYMANEYDFHERTRILAADTEFDSGKWRAYAEMGWLALPFPEDMDGGAGTALDVMLLMQAFGRALVAEPYLASVVLGGLTVLDAGSPAQRQRILPDVIAGQTQLALACTEPQSGYDPFDVQTSATRTASGYVLNGNKAVVLNAAAADTLIVSARSAGSRTDRAGLSLFLVARSTPGLTLRPYQTIDGRRAAEVRLENVQVRDEDLLGAAHEAAAHLERTILNGTVALLGEAVGCLEGAVACTAEYLNNREQFGQKLAKFQALRHRVADMFVAKEETRALCLLAAHAVATNDARAAELVAAAKAYAGKIGRHVCEDAVQLHGAIAITDEYIVGHYLKRLIAIDRMFGDSSDALDRYLALRGGFDDDRS